MPPMGIAHAGKIQLSGHPYVESVRAHAQGQPRQMGGHGQPPITARLRWLL